MEFMITIIIALVILALIIFPEFRKKLMVLLRGGLNVFVEDAAKTPEGAEAVFAEAIAEERELYNNASRVLNKASGELKSAEDNLAKIQTSIRDVEAMCERLVQQNKMDDARVYAERRADLLDELAQANELVAMYKPMVAEAKETYEYRQKRLQELQREKKKTISRMKLDMQVKDMHEDMDEMRSERASHKMLDAVKEGASDLRKEATGARIVHENRASTKIARAEKNASQAKTDDYLNSLKKKNGGK